MGVGRQGERQHDGGDPKTGRGAEGGGGAYPVPVSQHGKPAMSKMAKLLK